MLARFHYNVAGGSNRTYVSRLNHKHGCCNNFINWLLFDHRTWIVRVIPISLVDVTVTDHSANVSGVIVVMATHVVMPFLSPLSCNLRCKLMIPSPGISHRDSFLAKRTIALILWVSNRDNHGRIICMTPVVVWSYNLSLSPLSTLGRGVPSPVWTKSPKKPSQVWTKSPQGNVIHHWGFLLLPEKVAPSTDRCYHNELNHQNQ